MTETGRPDYAPDWSEADCEAWIVDYLADKPVELPYAEHEPESCDHCDRLRELMREAGLRGQASDEGKPE